MVAIESAFLKDAQRLNDKRLPQLMKRVGKAISEGEDAVQAMQMPSQKEYRKLIRSLVINSSVAGYQRASIEMDQLTRRYNQYAEQEQLPAYNDDLPPELQTFLEQYALQITVITEETVLNRIKEILIAGLQAGTEPAHLVESVQAAAEVALGAAHATTIVRTEMSKMYNAARLARYTSPENKGFVVALQYDAIIDTRTTHICQHLDGRIIAIDRMDLIMEYSPPNHFQCRSVWLPVTKFELWNDNWSTEVEPQQGFANGTPDIEELRGLANS
ncbi:phage head morphogenesis protein [Bacillus toyonensis]|nr:phage head morphogenesis protein [Bacillus toyonensis]